MRNLQEVKKAGILLKFGFYNKSLWKDAPLTSWTLLSSQKGDQDTKSKFYMKIQLKIQSKIRRNPCGILIPFKFLKTPHQLDVKNVFKYPIFYGIPWYLRNSVRYDVQMLHSGSSATGIGVAGILCPQWWSSVEQGQLKHFFSQIKRWWDTGRIFSN